MSNRLLVIVGPTASGKSELAVRLAKKFDGEVISADSRQVYKGMDIGTGKVPRDKNPKPYILNPEFYTYKGIPHHMFDIASPKRTFTVAEYQKLALKTIKDIWQRGKLPILCGGTGLYIRAVRDGLVFPEVPPNLKLRIKLEKKSTKELFEILQKKDPRRAENIDSQNRRRLIRALEIIEKLGFVPELGLKPIYAKVPTIGITKDKETLKNLIRKRLFKRLRVGMIKEVKKLHSSGISWKKLENFGLEYRQIARFLQNKISKKEMIETLFLEIYTYAKRQMTWFKKDETIRWIKNYKEAEDLIKKSAL